jgi:hypothetical protein
MKKEYEIVEENCFGVVTVVKDGDGYCHNVTKDLIYSTTKFGVTSIFQIRHDLSSSKLLMTINDD